MNGAMNLVEFVKCVREYVPERMESIVHEYIDTALEVLTHAFETSPFLSAYDYIAVGIEDVNLDDMELDVLEEVRVEEDLSDLEHALEVEGCFKANKEYVNFYNPVMHLFIETLEKNGFEVYIDPTTEDGILYPFFKIA